MKLTRVFVVSAFVAGAFMLACSGGSGSTSGSSGGGATSNGFIDEYCAVFTQCCGQNGYPTDGAQCRSFAGQSAAGREYNAAKGDECLAGLRAAAAKPEFCTTPDAPEVCNEVYKSAGGGVAPGSPCEDDSDCASSPEGEAECASTFRNGATTQTCQIRVRGKEGESCIGTKDGNTTTSFGSSGDSDAGAPPAKVAICHTEDQLHCDSTTDTCKRIADVGGDCQSSFSSYACVKSAYCDAAQKKCVPRLAAGADCSNVSQDACAEDHYCDEATKKCALAIADGAPCQKSNQCKSRSCTNGKCETTGLGELVFTLLCGPKSGG